MLRPSNRGSDRRRRRVGRSPTAGAPHLIRHHHSSSSEELALIDGPAIHLRADRSRSMRVGICVGKKPQIPCFAEEFACFGGDGGIRTLDRALQPYNGLANRRLQPLGHVSTRGRYARRSREPQAARFWAPQGARHSGNPADFSADRQQAAGGSPRLLFPARTPRAGERIIPRA